MAWVCHFQFSLRSGIPGQKEALTQQSRSLAETSGFSLRASGDYPEWAFRSNSPLRMAACQIYQQLWGQPMSVATIHAGTECSIFASRIPQLDCISIGPNIWAVHSLDERVSISSVGRVWTFLNTLLETLGKESHFLPD